MHGPHAGPVILRRRLALLQFLDGFPFNKLANSKLRGIIANFQIGLATHAAVTSRQARVSKRFMCWASVRILIAIRNC